MLNPSRILYLAFGFGTITDAASIPIRSDGPAEALGGPKEVLRGPWEVLRGPWEVLMIWEKDVESGKQTTTIWDTTQSNLLERSCTDTVDFGGVSIQVEVDDEGAGTISVDHQKYMIDLNQGSSVSCSRMYNPKHAVSQCYIKLPAGKAKRSLEPLDNSGPIECFKGLPDQYPLRTTTRVLSVEPGTLPMEALEEADSHNSTSLETRQHQNPCGRVRTDTSLVLGHGWPWKYTRHGQVSTTLPCGGGQCSVGQDTTHTVQWTAAFTPSVPFFAAGFQVAFSTARTEGIRCGATGMQNVCIWNWWRHQSYRLNSITRDNCDIHRQALDYEMRAPMTAEHHQSFYCVVNHCRSRGEWYWEAHGDGRW